MWNVPQIIYLTVLWLPAYWMCVLSRIEEEEETEANLPDTNEPFHPSSPNEISQLERMTAFIAFERLFFAVFGQTTPEDINPLRGTRPEWTENLFKLVFGVYLLVSVIVLINLLIAMMSDTYQRIQVTRVPIGACY